MSLATLSRRNICRFFWVTFVAYSFSVFADPLSELLSRGEFEKLARELAPKVNLFAEVWRQDPNAEFFGGSSRDFLYWIRRELQGAKNRNELDARIAVLRALPIIDVRSFITRESDIDLLSDRGVSIDAGKFAIKKVDVINKRRLDSSTPEGKSEIDQGFIPVEKIRLSKNGVEPPKQFGDGLTEILTGKLSIQFPESEKFAATQYAIAGRNHEVLLALRFLRLKAMDHYYRKGRAPVTAEIFDLPGDVEKHLKEVIAKAAVDPRLSQLLSNPAFAAKFNETIHKAFRTYTNPTAALAWYQHTGADKLVSNFQQIEPINQYLFAKDRNVEQIRNNFQEFGVSENNVLSSIHTHFPNGKMYHGTKREDAFRSILTVGVLPSQKGTVGPGLYAVSEHDIPFAIRWGESKDRVIVFPIEPNARIIDISSGPGATLWSNYVSRFGNNIDAFADFFGADIIKYPYDSSRYAYVVKNSTALGSPSGYTRQLRTVNQLLDSAKNINTTEALDKFLEDMKLAALTYDEKEAILRTVPLLTKVFESAENTAEVENLLQLHEILRLSDDNVIDILAKSTDPNTRARLSVLRNLEAGLSKTRAKNTIITITRLFGLLDRMNELSAAGKKETSEFHALDKRAEITLEKLLVTIRDDLNEINVNRRMHGRGGEFQVDGLPTVHAIQQLLQGKDAELNARWLHSKLDASGQAMAKKMEPIRKNYLVNFLKSLLIPSGLGLLVGAGAEHVAHFPYGTWVGLGAGLLNGLNFIRQAKEIRAQEKLETLMTDHTSFGFVSVTLDDDQRREIANWALRNAESIRKKGKPVAPTRLNESARDILLSTSRPSFQTLHEALRFTDQNLKDRLLAMGVMSDVMPLAKTPADFLEIIERLDLLWWDIHLRSKKDPAWGTLDLMIRDAVVKLGPWLTDPKQVNYHVRNKLTYNQRTREIILEEAIRVLANSPQVRSIDTSIIRQPSDEFVSFQRQIGLLPSSSDMINQCLAGFKRLLGGR